MTTTKRNGKRRKSKTCSSNSKYVVEGKYGINAITHCCLEPHGTTLHWEGGRLKVYLSTQNVSQSDDGFAGALDITADDVDVTCRLHWRRIRQQVPTQLLGHRRSRDRQKGGTASQVHALTRSRTEDRRQPSLRLHRSQARCGRRRRGPSLGFPSLGHLRVQRFDRLGGNCSLCFPTEELGVAKQRGSLPTMSRRWPGEHPIILRPVRLAKQHSTIWPPQMGADC